MVTVASRCLAGALCACLILAHFVTAAPPSNNYEGLREWYQQLIDAGAAGSPGDGFEQGVGGVAGPPPVGLLSLLGGPGVGAGPGTLPLANHQLVRKSNRTPSLRLRYGRRSDPAMPMMKSSCFEQSVDES